LKDLLTFNSGNYCGETLGIVEGDYIQGQFTHVNSCWVDSFLGREIG